MCSKRFILPFNFSLTCFCVCMLPCALVEVREQLAGVVLSFCLVDSRDRIQTHQVLHSYTTSQALLYTLSHLASPCLDLNSDNFHTSYDRFLYFPRLFSPLGTLAQRLKITVRESMNSFISAPNYLTENNQKKIFASQRKI